MALSFQNADNFIRNAVTISTQAWADGRGACGYVPPMEKLDVGGLPVDLEEIMLDLRIDDPDEEAETVERMARAACAFIEKRTAYALLPTRYQILMDSVWAGGLTVERGPLRGPPVIEVRTARDTWEAVDPESYWDSARARSFTVRTLSSLAAPTAWQSEDCVRLTFEVGFDSYDESGGTLTIEDGLRTILMMITGHYYQNRELLGVMDPASGVNQMELGASSILAQYRQFW